jgi:hypothetical protein
MEQKEQVNKALDKLFVGFDPAGWEKSITFHELSNVEQQGRKEKRKKRKRKKGDGGAVQTATQIK